MLSKLQSEPVRMPLPAPLGNVSVENMIVGAPNSRVAIIKGISFAVPAGTIVGVIGPSASGKSTLARALLGIWPPQHGTVRLDGADISNWDKIELGPHIGYLPQDIELFEGTVGDNIARFGEVDPEMVVQAAKVAGVHEMILLLPEGYDTVIGSDGVSLSGGQRQRVGLARALYGTPKLIILDEPNSNLDEIGERALSYALTYLKAEGSTVFVITHRTNILSQLDRLLVMKDGLLSMFGPTEQVVAELSAKANSQKNQVATAGAAPTSA
jgi:ATP-binding cassette subfamily C protein EexD